nr:hypothetical protein [uncultured Methanolobus sp.]
MKIKKVILSILVVSIMLIGTGWADSSASNVSDNTDLIEEEYIRPDYNSEIFDALNDNPIVINIKGTMPEIAEEDEKQEWRKELNTCIQSSENELIPYMKSNGGPVVGFGYSFDGYIFVDIDQSLKDSIDRSTIDEIYNIIYKNSRSIGLTNVPVVFTEANIVLTSREDYGPTMIGGLELVTIVQGSQDLDVSTISFAAEDSSGTKGFVISGHVAKDAGMGANVYHDPGVIGQVTDYVGLFADAAWVERSDVADDIYYSDNNILKDVTQYGDPSNGSKVYISGVESEIQYGYIDRAYALIDNGAFPFLRDQFTASYTSDFGDSGAPVFQKTLGGVKLVGVHWGYNSATQSSAFSPISGVILDLDVEPLI